MKVVMRLIIFSIILNMATGILINQIVDSEGNKIFDGDINSYRGAIPNYNPDALGQFETVDSDNLAPQSVLQSASDAFYQLLDKIGLGFISRFFTIVGKYLYGFPTYLQTLLSKYIDPATGNFIFDALVILINLAYTFAGIQIWSGRNLFHD